jgi:hypothetical protein
MAGLVFVCLIRRSDRRTLSLRLSDEHHGLGAHQLYLIQYRNGLTQNEPMIAYVNNVTGLLKASKPGATCVRSFHW